jgi:hypothetical protein
MLALLPVFALSAPPSSGPLPGGYAAVPLNNSWVVKVHDYAIAALRTLFPEAPATGDYPQIVDAAIQLVEGENVRLIVVLTPGVELRITIHVDLNDKHYVLAIDHDGFSDTSPDHYLWESATSFPDRLVLELRTQLREAPYNFSGQIAEVLAWRTRTADGHAHIHVIFRDESEGAHSAVFTTSGTTVTVSEFRSLTA